MVRVSMSVVMAAAKRTPMIRFRKGASGALTGGHAQEIHNTGTSIAPAAVSSSGSAIEDWQLPTRYARKGIDAAEMAYINRGGPE